MCFSSERRSRLPPADCLFSLRRIGLRADVFDGVAVGVAGEPRERRDLRVLVLGQDAQQSVWPAFASGLRRFLARACSASDSPWRAATARPSPRRRTAEPASRAASAGRSRAADHAWRWPLAGSTPSRRTSAPRRPARTPESPRTSPGCPDLHALADFGARSRTGRAASFGQSLRQPKRSIQSMGTNTKVDSVYKKSSLLMRYMAWMRFMLLQEGEPTPDLVAIDQDLVEDDRGVVVAALRRLGELLGAVQRTPRCWARRRCGRARAPAAWSCPS